MGKFKETHTKFAAVRQECRTILVVVVVFIENPLNMILVVLYNASSNCLHELNIYFVPMESSKPRFFIRNGNFYCIMCMVYYDYVYLAFSVLTLRLCELSCIFCGFQDICNKLEFLCLLIVTKRFSLSLSLALIPLYLYSICLIHFYLSFSSGLSWIIEHESMTPCILWMFGEFFRIFSAVHESIE